MLKKLFDSKKTVFLVEDLAKIFDIKNRSYLRLYLSRMTKRGDLLRIKRGIYTYSKDYNRLELANKLKRPSYVSMERILFDNEIIFQDYSNSITSISTNSYREKVGITEYTYLKIKDEIFVNPAGVLTANNARIASSERAICDMIYFAKNFHFDNLDNVDKAKLLEISKLYTNRVIREVEKICS
jgi:predicted transcriptional regulator of viral defense system